MRPRLDKKNFFGVSQRYRLSRALSTVLVLSLIQIIAVPVFVPTLAPQAQAANLYDNRTNFQQWTTWHGVAANHVPYKTSSGTAEITSNSDAINLTQDFGSQTGFLWNTQTLNYTQDLSVSANIYLGAKDGADGVMFSMRPLNQWPNGGTAGASTGNWAHWATGELRAIFDTYQNGSERAEDHLRVMAVTSGNVEKIYTGSGILLKNGSGVEVTDVENNQSYPFTFRWTAATRTFAVYSGLAANHLIYSTAVTSAELDATQFAWGWMGFTGGASNFQAISDVSYHVGPTVSSSDTDRTVADGASVTLSASFTSSETSPTRRWEYSTDGGSTWTSTGSSDSTYTFTASRSLTQRKYRFYVESTAVGVTYSKSTTPITLTVNPPPLRSETDTAVNTSGNRFFYAPNANSILPGTMSTFTMEAWIKPSTTCDGNYYCSVFASNNSVFLSVYQGNITYVIGSGTAWCSGGAVTQVSKVVPSGSWTHVAMVRNSANVKIYLNGSLVSNLDSSCNPTTMTAPSNQQFGLGYRHTLDQYFYGSIDEARIWTSDRSASIASDMHSNETSTANLIGYWNFNEGTGETAYNQVPTAQSSSDLISYGTDKSNPAFWDSASISEETITNAYSVRTFHRTFITANNGWKAPRNVQKLQYLVVAGGGAGGTSQVAGEFASGGGGGGGVRQGVTQIATEEVVSVQVGLGQVSAGCVQGRGQNSVISGSSVSTISATGGGSGACIPFSSSPYTLTAGQTGGSGGGGGSWADRSASAGSGNLGAYSPVEGFAGGAARVDGGSGPGQAGGGGGGAGAIGGSPSYLSSAWNAGNGGMGVESTITGSSVFYGGGGGGGKRGSIIGGNGGNGGGGNGGDNSSQGTSGTNGLGGGGGGNSKTSGNHGGSGIVIIRWITASAPIYTPPVAVDTTTAGLRKTFQMSGSANSPLIRNYIWQFSSDTQTTWTTLQASTSDSYTTTTLETTTSGSRYSYRVIVTDSDTAGLSISESSTFTLVINPRITITGSSVSLTQKYGETQTVTYTIAHGTGTRTTVASPNNRTGITWSSVSGDSATIGIGSGLSVGTYYETLTVTDSVTATTTQMITISISKADTITVTVNSPSALNYTGSTASFTPSVTFGGLQSTDAATASSVTITQTRAGNTCAMGGTCSIGDRGPGGGIVFITPSTASGNGKYFEAAPDAWYGTNDLSSVGKFCTAASSRDNTNEGATQYGIGWGETNTAIFIANCTGGAVKLATDYRGGGFSDWFVPSANELDEMRANYSTVDLIKVSGYWGYWSSSENSASVMKSLDNSGSWVMGAVNKSDSTHNMIRPVRMFTPCNEVDSCTAFASTTMPTNAGTYRLTPSALSLSSGDLANYQGVTYASGLLTINKVSQTPITIGQYDAYPGVSTYPLNVYGGSGTGVMRRALTSAGTASCELTNIMFLTATIPGICDVRVTKAADFNYLAAEATATIYWIQFQTNYSNGAAGGATGITLTGETAIEKRTYETFTVLSFANGSGAPVTSVAMNSIMRIIGTGFNPNDETTEVIIGFTNIPKSSLTFDITDPLANFVQFRVPDELDLGANEVAMRSAKGWAEAPETLNISGILMAAM